MQRYKRHANNGESILITEPHASEGQYKKGDILKVKSQFGTGFVITVQPNCLISDNEYCVVKEDSNDD